MQFYKTKKSLGQYFLQNKRIIKSIITHINPQRNQTIVEIGPGLGALTKVILKYINFLTVIELDKNLANFLSRKSTMKKKLCVIQEDATKTNFLSLSSKLSTPLRIFGNLPYNVSIPLIINIFKYVNIIYDMHFMLQKEVASRLCANHNTKNYGRLSIIAQYHCQVIPLIEVPPTAFIPMPKVDSILVQLIPYSIRPYYVSNLDKLNILTKKAFNQRRKMISNSLKSLFNNKQLIEQNIDLKLRAENLSIKQYCHLANILDNKNY